MVPTKNGCPYVTMLGADVITGRAPLKRYPGEYTSASWLPSPPPESTRPSGNSSVKEWYPRYFVKLATVVQVSATGSHNSPAYTAPAALLKPGRLPPPVTSTVPSGNSVAFI